VALVGSPDRDYLWLLSREAEVDAATRDALLDEARKRGYDISELIWRGESS
jgi:apolipoprotein D and lipocalin family protein